MTEAGNALVKIAKVVEKNQPVRVFACVVCNIHVCAFVYACVFLCVCVCVCVCCVNLRMCIFVYGVYVRRRVHAYICNVCSVHMYVNMHAFVYAYAYTNGTCTYAMYVYV